MWLVGTIYGPYDLTNKEIIYIFDPIFASSLFVPVHSTSEILLVCGPEEEGF
jgi:hypothetical protein